MRPVSECVFDTKFFKIKTERIEQSVYPDTFTVDSEFYKELARTYQSEFDELAAQSDSYDHFPLQKGSDKT